jgi:hypothetical protein
MSSFALDFVSTILLIIACSSALPSPGALPTDDNGFLPVLIPPNGPGLTIVNESVSQWMANICGQHHNATRRYPWAVSIMHMGKNKIGGTIISPFHILTAAHAFLRFDNSAPGACDVIGYKRFWSLRDRIVAFGDDCIRGRNKFLPNNPLCSNTTVQFRRIKRILVDGGFALGGCVDGHDWAIVEVDKPIQFDDRVRPLCLPYANQQIHDFLTAVGWGKAHAFTEGDPLIREIRMLYDRTCKAPWADAMPTDVPDYVCAKSLNPRDYFSARTCHGDSGSGLEQLDGFGRSTLMGITSFGSRGCPPNELARFTNVQRYLGPICRRTGICYSYKANTI